MGGRKTDIGAMLQVEQGTPPLADTGSTVNGTGIDRSQFQSCVLGLSSGAATGTPCTQLGDARLQDSADNSTFADFTDDQGNGAVAQISGDDEDAYTAINLRTAEKFIRVVRVIAFTGGSSPDWPVATPVILGGALNTPTTL